MALNSPSYPSSTINNRRPVAENLQFGRPVSSGSNVELRDMKTRQLSEEPDTEEVYPALLSVLPVVRGGPGSISDFFSLHHWQSPHLWRAGLLEGAGSACLAFVSGALSITLSGWPVAAVPAGIFFGNTTLVSLIIFATSTTTGAHINLNITISTAFCGLCHPARAGVYVFCQLVGGAIGGAFLRAGLGETKAVAFHNGGCWLEPNGAVSVGQATAMEFMATFCLLYIAYGVGLDPRQAQLYGAGLGPLLVGLLVGLLTSLTGTIAAGYTGAGMFPGRCFGLAAGMGVFQSSHWVWWVPDIAACFVHSLLYRFAPPYRKEYITASAADDPKPSV